jgi:hypothetical protein
MRRREVRLDNLAVTVSPLSYDEVQRYAREQKLLTERNADAETFLALTLRVVAAGLNNAMSDAEYRDWTPDAVRREFDAPFLGELQKAIFEMSGLVVFPEAA